MTKAPRKASHTTNTTISTNMTGSASSFDDDLSWGGGGGDNDKNSNNHDRQLDDFSLPVCPTKSTTTQKQKHKPSNEPCMVPSSPTKVPSKSIGMIKKNNSNNNTSTSKSNLQFNSSFVLPPDHDSMWDTAEVDALDIDGEIENGKGQGRSSRDWNGCFNDDENSEHNDHESNHRFLNMVATSCDPDDNQRVQSKRMNKLNSSSSKLFANYTSPRKVKIEEEKSTEKFNKSLGDLPATISFNLWTDADNASKKTLLRTSTGNDNASSSENARRRGKRNNASKLVAGMPGIDFDEDEESGDTQLRSKTDNSSSSSNNNNEVSSPLKQTHRDVEPWINPRDRHPRSRSRSRDGVISTLTDAGGQSSSRQRSRSQSLAVERSHVSDGETRPTKSSQQDRSRDRTTDYSDQLMRRGRRSRSRGPLDGKPKKNDTSSGENANDRSSRRERSLGPLTKDREKSSRRERSLDPSTKDRERSSRRERSLGPLTKDHDRSSRRERSPGPLTKDHERSSRRERSPGPLTKDHERSFRRERSLGPLTKDHETSSRQERSSGPSTMDRERSSRRERSLGQVVSRLTTEQPLDRSRSPSLPLKTIRSRRIHGCSDLPQRLKSKNEKISFHASLDDLGALGFDLDEILHGGRDVDQTTAVELPRPSRQRNISRTKSLNEDAIRLKNRALGTGLHVVDQTVPCTARLTGLRGEKSLGNGRRSSRSSRLASDSDERRADDDCQPRQLSRRKSHLDTVPGKVDKKASSKLPNKKRGEEKSIFSTDSSESRYRDKKVEMSKRSRRSILEQSMPEANELKIAREKRKAEEAKLKRLQEQSKLLEEKRLAEEARLKILQEESRILKLKRLEDQARRLRSQVDDDHEVDDVDEEQNLRAIISPLPSRSGLGQRKSDPQSEGSSIGGSAESDITDGGVMSPFPSVCADASLRRKSLTVNDRLVRPRGNKSRWMATSTEEDIMQLPPAFHAIRKQNF